MKGAQPPLVPTPPVIAGYVDGQPVRVVGVDAPEGIPVERFCEVHTWTGDGLARRLFTLMRARKLGGQGVNVCTPCVTRIKESAKGSEP